MIQLLHGDCLELMKQIPDGSIDMVLTDPPYGTTACKWDAVIPFGPMWKELKRIIKPNGVIALFGSEPFSSALRMSNINQYRYDWIWIKNVPSGFNYARFQPMRQNECISIFYDKLCYYDCDGVKYPRPIKYKMAYSESDSSHMTHSRKGEFTTATNKKKTNVLFYDKIRDGFHPTQKPVALLKYLIQTYTKEGETVLDFTMGSGSTGVAAVTLNRDFVGIEMDAKYFKTAEKRIKQFVKEPIHGGKKSSD